MKKEELMDMIREIIAEETGKCPVKLCKLKDISVTEADLLDTGDSSHRVYTHDVLTLSESPRLGAGIMEMEKTTFPWQLNYDEVDYVIKGSLTVYYGETAVTAGEGEMIFIPKGSKIMFSAPDFARFLYVTYPADWQGA